MKTADSYASAERGNIARYIAMEILNAFTYLFMGGTLWQGLLLHNHCSQAMIGGQKDGITNLWELRMPNMLKDLMISDIQFGYAGC